MRTRLSPQCQQILAHIQAAGHITRRDAMLNYGIMSISRRITDLKEAGYDVTFEDRHNPGTGQRYRRYMLGDFGAEVAA